MVDPLVEEYNLLVDKEKEFKKLAKNHRREYEHSKSLVALFKWKTSQELLESTIKRKQYVESEIQKYSKTTLGNLLPQDEVVKNDIYKQLVEISLASDYLYQTVETFRETLNKLGISTPDIHGEVKRLSQMANKTASRLLCEKAPKLSEVLLEDEELLGKLHEDAQNYITKTLKMK